MIVAILFVLIVAAPGFYALAYLVQSTTRVISTLLWLAFWFWIGFVVPLVLDGRILQIYKNKAEVSVRKCVLYCPYGIESDRLDDCVSEFCEQVSTYCPV